MRNWILGSIETVWVVRGGEVVIGWVAGQEVVEVSGGLSSSFESNAVMSATALFLGGLMGSLG